MAMFARFLSVAVVIEGDLGPAAVRARLGPWPRPADGIAPVADLPGHPGDAVALTRVRDGWTTTWYRSTVQALRDAAAAGQTGPIGAPVRAAEWDQLSDAQRASWVGVVLDGDAVLGVKEHRLPPPVALGGLESFTGTDADPHAPLEAWPRLEAPDVVPPASAFTLTVGLSATGTGAALALAGVGDRFDLTLHVTAPGFGTPSGATFVLAVERAHLDAACIAVPLVAPLAEGPGRIDVDFYLRGTPVGRAWCSVGVSATPGWRPRGPSGASALRTTASERPADLTVTLRKGPGTLLWSFATPHALALPTEPAETTLGDQDASAFALSVLQAIPNRDATGFVGPMVRGVARQIARKVPGAFWTALEQVWHAVHPRVPTILLVSAETYIPWELAAVTVEDIGPGLLDPARPAVLGAQVCIGRWLPAGAARAHGPARPAPAPPENVALRGLAVVTGDYLAMSGLRPLPKAKDEGAALVAAYGGVALTADEPSMLALLEDPPPDTNALHFACHGEVDLANPQRSGIVLNDNNERLDPTIIQGSVIVQARRPFVFLNACQLGQAAQNLASYGGMAGAFVGEGAVGFVAPLWSVDDTIAHDLALEFYQLALGGTPVAEVMRTLRARYQQGAPASTWLAYVYYGHPNLLLSRV